MVTLWMACLLVIGGGFSSCADDYKLDDEKPNWLKKSIYQTLLEDGNYSTYLRLLSDSDVNSLGERSLVDVLNKTGSKTVFAAPDSAWDTFFKNNAKELAKAKASGQVAYDPWLNATSYENLTKSQKNLLMHTSMLSNAIVTENFSTSLGADGIRGSWMRRSTDVQVSDTITRLPENQIPYSYSDSTLQLRAEKKITDHDYWARFKTKNGGSGHVYVVCDNDAGMMPYFTNEYLKNKTITDDDYKIFMNGETRETRDITLYDSKVADQDITCLNGYIDLCQKPLHPLGNLAEVIRTNGQTNIFSHMLDRFSVPLFDAELTKDYQNTYENFKDSIFVKRYFSSYSTGRKALEEADEHDNSYSFSDHNQNSLLKFDPGWNSYQSTDGDNVENTDMAVMFVPNDQTLKEYFCKTKYIVDGKEQGVGNRILEAQAKGWKEMSETQKLALSNEELYKYLDQIPYDIVSGIINEIMFINFSDAVPSKMTKLRNSAHDQIFYDDDTFGHDKDHIVSTKLANNGLLYIMDKVYTPADYASVAAPAKLDNDKTIMNWAIYSGSDGVNDLMGLNYYAYLKAMKSVYTFFIPNDSAMQYYYDIASFCGQYPRLLRFRYNSTVDKSVVPIYLQNFKNSDGIEEFICYKYDNEKGEIGGPHPYTFKCNADEILNKLREILETHTIVHDAETNPILTEDKEYYLTKKGSAIKVTRNADKTGLTKVQGGFQLYNEEHGLKDDALTTPIPTIGIDKVTVLKSNAQENGYAFETNSIIEQSPNSVYAVLSQYPHTYKTYSRDTYTYGEENPWGSFFELCNDLDDSEGILPGGTDLTFEMLLTGCKLIDTDLPQYLNNSTAVTIAVNKYRTFATTTAAKSTAKPKNGQKCGMDYDVQFFNNYNYTVFVPSNAAMAQAHSLGLPTWSEIRDDFKNNCKKSGSTYVVEDATAAERIRSKIVCVTNFVRNHFVDNSIFADKDQMDSTSYSTNCYDNDNHQFCTVAVKRNKNTDGELQVKNSFDKDYMSVDRRDGYHNLMTQDIECSFGIYGLNSVTKLKGMTIDASSYAVVHMIPGFLSYKNLGESGRYDDDWATPTASRKFVNRYAIK